MLQSLLIKQLIDGDGGCDELAINVDIYQSAAPVEEGNLFKNEMLSELSYVCKKISKGCMDETSYSEEETLNYFEELGSIISIFKHIEITLDCLDMDWPTVLTELMEKFPQIAWIKGMKEQEEQIVTYYFDFIPLAYQPSEIPFIVNLQKSLSQQLSLGKQELGTEVSEFLSIIVDICRDNVHAIKGSTIVILKEEEEKNEDNFQSFLKKERELTKMEDYIQYVEKELEEKKQVQKELRTTNQKMELVLERLSHQMIKHSLRELHKLGKEESDDWDAWIKIELREYVWLLQKAKFLEQVWGLNSELLVKNEAITIGTDHLTYERKQIKGMKEDLHSTEIYLVY